MPGSGEFRAGHDNIMAKVSLSAAFGFSHPTFQLGSSITTVSGDGSAGYMSGNRASISPLSSNACAWSKAVR